MTEGENVKVYELAKELGMDSISLLDKLKGLNISVKNHMSELGEADIRAARGALKKGAEGEKPAKKTAVARTRKKAPTAEAANVEAAPVASASDAEKKAAAPIIRRRVKADGQTETVTTGPTGASVIRHTAAEIAEAEAAAAAEEAAQQELAAAAEQQTGEEAQVAQEPEAASETVQETPTVEASAPQAGGEMADTTGAKPKRAPVVLTPRPVAPPRKSILKIVEAAAVPVRPIIKPGPLPTGAKAPVGRPGTTTQDRDGFRIIKMTKENLDQMAEEEAAKKRAGGGREAEIRPEDVRFADYRKKEMVFLPKKKKLPVGKEVRKTKLTQSAAHKRVVQMQDTITVADFAAAMHVKGVDVVRKLMQMGQMATINQAIDFDTASLIGAEFQHEVKNVAFNEVAVLSAVQGGVDKPEQLKPRPPVVTIMGHVDHGKTTLLDAIRETDVAGGEAGGITQHIGAYTVMKNGKMITFIDTPGHEAFTVMRARGANVTDIVILVVSADDGVMPQTREALSHAQAAKVPVIVAVNKIDKPGANPEKIKQSLAELNLLSEDWGGETMYVQVSALKKTNIDKLLDAILLQAEVLDLKANAEVPASGTVLEARLEKGRGPVVSILVSRGTLRVGDPIVSGMFTGRVKSMMDDKGRNIKETSPGMASEVQGFEGVPNAGEKFNATETESEAREIAEHRIDRNRERTATPALTGGKMVSLDALFAKIQSGDVKELNVILKADVYGSVEAIRDSLLKLSTEKVKIKVLLAAPGGVSESDVLLASASGAIIIGFNVRPETKARQLAEAEHVEIKTYAIIYELIDDIRNAMVGLLDKKKVEKFLGRAEVRQTFSVPKIGTIAGSSVVDGKILRGANVRLLRDSRIIFEGKMSSLKRFKDDAKEVAQGFECGIGIENYNDLKTGDIIEAYQIELIAGTLE